MALWAASIPGSMRLTNVVTVPRVIVVLTLLGCLAGGMFALHLGQDVNFDQMNYHYASAYEYLNDRLSFDASPEGLAHGYFNPLPYVPFYLMERHLSPRVVTFLQGCLHGINLGLVLLIAVLTTGMYAISLRALLCAGAVLVSVASPMALSEVGGSFADIATSIFVLAGVVLMIADAPPGRGRTGLLLTFLGAALIGIAIGLKLTNALYVPGVIACCAIGWRGWLARLWAMLCAGVGGVAGLLLASGAWFYRMWTMFRSPVFPYYDGVFRSPEIDSQSWLHGLSFFDARYIPTTILEAAVLPFRWLQVGQSTAELPFRDVRFALLFCVIVAAMGVAVAAAAGIGPKRRQIELPAAQSKLLIFFIVSFVAWMMQFSIQRYLVGVELLVGPVLIVALGYMLSGRVLAVAALGCGALSLMTVRIPDWGRIVPGTSWYAVQLPAALEQPGLVFLQGSLSFITPFLPASSHVVGLDGGIDLRAGSGILADRVVTSALAGDPSLPAFLFAEEPVRIRTRQTLAGYGLRLDGPCWLVPNRGKFLAACALTRMAHPGSSAAWLRPGEPILFNQRLRGMPYMLWGWHVDSAWGSIGPGFDPLLVMHIDPAFGSGPIRLNFTIAGIRDLVPGASVTLTANGHLAARWSPPLPASDGPFTACIPADALDGGRDVVLQFGYDVQPATVPSGGKPPPRDIAVGLQSLVADRTASCSAQLSQTP
jgi:hypothetical protein